MRGLAGNVDADVQGLRRSGALALANRAAALGAVVMFGLFVATWAQFVLTSGTANFGVDYTLYHDAGARWLNGDGFYLPHQLAGPYQVTHGDVLYPPPFLLLLVPFQALPAVLWWVIPIGVVVWIVVTWRPGGIAWLLIAACIFYPVTGVKLIHGNPGIWIAAAIALGTRYAWPSVLVLIKPTVFPFALIGIWSRRWWLALAGMAGVSLLFLPMWRDYIVVLMNAEASSTLLYSLNEVPMLAIPVIAWIGHGPRWRRQRDLEP